MGITVSGTSITFNDATVQTTAPTGGFSNMVVRTTGGAYTIPATKIKVTLVSGGGGSGGMGGFCNGVSGAGGAGGVSIQIFSGLTINNTLTLTIGAGGTAGTAGGGNGGSGGTTSVASGTQTITTVSATGGGGGSGGNPTGSPGGGGAGSGGILNLTGFSSVIYSNVSASGYYPRNFSIFNPYGSGAPPVVTQDAAGIAGAAGIVIIEY
jgi:hypothetical protein